MISSNKNIKILEPKTQLTLYGYENYFNSFIKIYKKNKLPNTMLLTGPKGLGKSTFVYHFINYLLTHDEKNKYSLKNFKIDKNNSTYKFIQNNTHPNFFLLENSLSNENIKIGQV